MLAREHSAIHPLLSVLGAFCHIQEQDMKVDPPLRRDATAPRRRARLRLKESWTGNTRHCGIVAPLYF